MKKTLLLALAVIAVGCTEPIPRNLDELSTQGPQYLDPETLEPYSGPAYQMSEDDSTEIVLRVNLRDGRLHGDFEDFDPERFKDLDLGIYQMGSYRDGQREGSYEYFYSSGVLWGRGNYKNGEQDGHFESLEENGQLRSISTYSEGVLNGPSEYYFENGQLQSKSNFKDDERHGLAESYHENGELFYRASYMDGEFHGPSESYYQNGQLIRKGTYNMGEQCGEWFEFGETVTHPPCPPDLEGGN
jgi:antitoxin component YwqK of YwqJK toxin-antitoxin module